MSFFHYWQNAFAGRMKCLRETGLARGPFFRDPKLKLFNCSKFANSSLKCGMFTNSGVRRKFPWGVSVGGHMVVNHIWCALFVTWHHFHVSKQTFWRSLLTKYVYLSTSTPLILCVVALNTNYQRSKLGYRRETNSSLRHSSSQMQTYQAAH